MRQIASLFSFIVWFSVVFVGQSNIPSAQNSRDGDVCLPPGISSAKNTPKSDLVLPEFVKDGQVFVFFDASTNMRGFVSSISGPSQASNSRYAQLVHIIPDIVNQVGTAGRFHRYRRELSTISGSQISSVTRPSFYQCDAGTPLGLCDDPRNQLAQILSLATRFPKNTLTVITSEFNLSDLEVRDRNPGSISDSTATLFRSGKSFGLYATKSEFKGIIHGLPGGVPFDKALERPVYILLIGPIEKIIKFRNILGEEFSDKKSQNTEKFFLFTNKLITNRITEQSFVNTDYELNNGATFENVFNDLTGIPQFGVPKNTGSVRLEVDLSKIQIPETLPLDNFVVSQKIWLQRSKKNQCDRQWLQVKKASSLASVIRQGKKVSLNFFADRSSMTKLPTRRKYFLTLNIKASSVSLSDRDKEWLAGWSFNVTKLDDLIAKQSAFFPTLNLDRFVQIMTTSSREAFRGGAILSFNASLTRNR